APGLGLYRDTWKALVRLHEEGRVRAIGVSNHHEEHLNNIIADTGVTPVLNQVEMHPYLQQNDLRAVHEKLDIVTEAWSPLGSGKGLLEDPVLGEIATKHGATPAQVTLAWHLALGNVVIPKSVTPSRIAENFESNKLNYNTNKLTAIAELDRGERTEENPEEAGIK